MRRQEARYLTHLLEKIPPQNAGVCVNIGSTDAEDLIKKPHIAAFYGRLAEAGYALVNVDLKQSPNVHLVGDIFDTAVQGRIRAMRPRLLLCCNVLEHVIAPRVLAAILRDLLEPGAHLICTIPHSYPFHADPIDTLFRPSPDDMRILLSPLDPVEVHSVEAGSFRSEIAERGGLPYMVRYLAGLVLPVSGFDVWKYRAHNLLWLARPYRVTCGLFRRAPDTAPV